MTKIMKTIEVTKFANCTAKKTSGSIDLWEWLLVKNQFIPHVERARLTNDEDEYKKIKKQLLPAITISATFSARGTENLIKHTGIICIDIDGKDNPDVLDIEELKMRLSKNKYVLYCGLSLSGKGLFCLIQIAYPEKHKEHFYSLENDFKLMKVIIDSNCSDVTRLRVYSYDINPYINHDAVVYYNTLEARESSLSTSEKKSRIQTNHNIKSNELKPQPDKKSMLELFLQPTQGYIQVKVESKADMVRGILNKVIDCKVDITERYVDWFKICCIIKNRFGEDGHSLFHEVSKFYPKYCSDVADRMYSSIKQDEYRCNSNALIEIVERYGIY